MGDDVQARPSPLRLVLHFLDKHNAAQIGEGEEMEDMSPRSAWWHRSDTPNSEASSTSGTLFFNLDENYCESEGAMSNWELEKCFAALEALPSSFLSYSALSDLVLHAYVGSSPALLAKLQSTARWRFAK